MDFLTDELVSHEYRDQLIQDLAKAKVCRFLVAYISGEGLGAIGRHLLSRGLGDERSFGVGSLTCSCGYEPLLRLQSEISAVRLKYFLDPLVKVDGEPNEISLFHSKLVYLYLEREAKSVVYIGSHNWTRRAIGPGGPRNAEASLRFELDYAPEHLEGSDTSVASAVNRHLLSAWESPLCLPATQTNEPTFREWFAKGCQRSADSPLQNVTILLAVRRAAGDYGDWLDLAGRGIYLQVLDESEGKLVWDSNNRLRILVWNSEAALASAEQPVILECAITTSKAGIDSRLRGTNQSVAPVAGFEAVIWDDTELNAMRNSQRGQRSSIRLWSGRDVHVYDFEFPTPHTDSSQLDGPIRPKYQFHLEVEKVVLPASAAAFREISNTKKPEYVWTPETFSVAASRESARIEESPGYFVEPERERMILEFMQETLLVQPEEAKVLPYSKADRMKVGKRISKHPLHETFLDSKWKQKPLRDDYYQRSKPGVLLAELDDASLARSLDHEDADEGDSDPIPRLQRVFTTPISKLTEIWQQTAKMLPTGKPRSEDP